MKTLLNLLKRRPKQSQPEAKALKICVNAPDPMVRGELEVIRSFMVEPIWQKVLHATHYWLVKKWLTGRVEEDYKHGFLDCLALFEEYETLPEIEIDESSLGTTAMQDQYAESIR